MDKDMRGGKRPDGDARWTSLRHAGIGVWPEYKAHGIPVVVNGNEVVLPRLAEHMLTEYVSHGGTFGKGATLFGSAQAAVNFHDDFLNEYPIREPEKAVIDARLIRDWISRTADESRTYTRTLMVEMKESFSRVVIDGATQEIAPFVVDRPGIIRSKSSRLNGRFRKPVTHSDITLNLSVDAPVPPGKWSSVVHNQHVDWIAKWRDHQTLKTKYARISMGSPSEQEAERLKFENSRQLVKDMPKMKRKIAHLTDSTVEQQQGQGVCIWLVQHLCLRVGSQDTNDVAFGATTLQSRHIKDVCARSFVLEFPGKSGVKYVRKVTGVPSKIVDIIRGRKKSHRMALFPDVCSKTLNRIIASVTRGRTAKELRTAGVCALFVDTLDDCMRSAKSTLKSPHEKTTQARLALSLGLALAASQANHRRGCDNDDVNLTRKLSSMIKSVNDGDATHADLNRLIKGSCLSVQTTVNSYIDPRIVVAFCKKYNVNNPYHKAYERRAQWALETSSMFDYYG